MSYTVCFFVYTLAAAFQSLLTAFAPHTLQRSLCSGICRRETLVYVCFILKLHIVSSSARWSLYRLNPAPSPIWARKGKRVPRGGKPFEQPFSHVVRVTLPSKGCPSKAVSLVKLSFRKESLKETPFRETLWREETQRKLERNPV